MYKQSIQFVYLFVLGIVSPFLFAQSPQPASVFGNNGHINFSLSSATQLANPKAAIIQNDGWVVIGGIGSPGPPWPQSLMLRFNPTCGTVDSSFGNNGIFVQPIQAISTISSLALQSDGKIVASGDVNSNFDTNGFPLVFRINPDGTMDSTFNETGFVRDNFRGGIGDAQKVLVTNNDEIIVLVKGGSSFNQGFGAIKYKNSGERDSTFGINGFTDFPYNYAPGQRGHTGCMGADSSIWMVALVGSGPFGTRHPAIAKITPDGQPDESFNDSGFRDYPEVNFNLQSNHQLHMEELPNGNVLISYGINEPNQYIAKLMMIKSNGDLDSSFAENGIFAYSTTAVNGNFQFDDQGNILFFIGVHWNNGPAGILRILPNGTLDPSFGNNGLVAFSYLPDNGGNDFRKFGGGFILPNGDLLAYGDRSQTSFIASRFTFNPAIDGIPQITQNNNELSTIGLGTFQWFLNDEPIEGATSSTFTAVENGSYTVSMGFPFCEFMSEPVTINNSPVSVYSAMSNSLRVRNNPTADVIYIDNLSTSAFYELMNMEGKVVEAQRRVEQNQINLQHLPPGMYILRILNSDENSVFKVIKTSN